MTKLFFGLGIFFLGLTMLGMFASIRFYKLTQNDIVCKGILLSMMLESVSFILASISFLSELLLKII